MPDLRHLFSVKFDLTTASAMPRSKRPASGSAAGIAAGSSSEAPGQGDAPKKRGRGRPAKKPRLPGEPRRPLSAYFMFLSDRRPGFTADNPKMAAKDIVKALGRLQRKTLRPAIFNFSPSLAASWKSLPDKEKQPFLTRAAADKERYERDKEAFNNNNVDKGASKAGKVKKGGSGEGQQGAPMEEEGHDDHAEEQGDQD